MQNGSLFLLLIILLTQIILTSCQQRQLTCFIHRITPTSTTFLCLISSALCSTSCPRSILVISWVATKTLCGKLCPSICVACKKHANFAYLDANHYWLTMTSQNCLMNYSFALSYMFKLILFNISCHTLFVLRLLVQYVCGGTSVSPACPQWLTQVSIVIWFPKSLLARGSALLFLST